jgi:hypothetical protein
MPNPTASPALRAAQQPPWPSAVRFAGSTAHRVEAEAAHLTAPADGITRETGLAALRPHPVHAIHEALLPGFEEALVRPDHTTGREYARRRTCSGSASAPGSSAARTSRSPSGSPTRSV